MKKKIIFLLLIFIFPLIVYADRSNSVSINCSKELKVGDRANLVFNVDFKDINKSQDENSPSNGYILYAFEFEYDDSVIDVYDLKTSSVWDAAIYKDSSSGKYVFAAELNGNTDSSFCPNKVSYCNGSSVTLSIGIKETDKTSTTIKVTKLGGAFINTDGQREISENDVKAVEVNLNTTHTISISKYEEQPRPKDDRPKYVIPEKSNTNVTQEIKKETATTVKKQNKTTTNNTQKTETNTTTDDSNKAYNYYLKILEIDGYKIDFNKHQAIYSIEVPQEVRELKINAVPESSNAKVEIIGADNLDENNNQVIITVTAENKDEKKYIINIKRKKEDKKEKNSSFEITDDQKKTIAIFSGIAVGIGLLIFIIIRIRDKKIEKGMDKW